MTKRERRYIATKKTRTVAFQNSVVAIPSDHSKTISWLDNHPGITNYTWNIKEEFLVSIT